MKRLFYLLSPMFILTSCYIENIQPRYDARDRILGYYDVEEYSETFNDMTYYSMHISRGTFYDEIFLDNFYASNIRVFATVSYDKITIPMQVVDGYEIEGTGTIFGNQLELTYRVKDRISNSKTDFCETKAWME